MTIETILGMAWPPPDPPEDDPEDAPVPQVEEPEEDPALPLAA